MRGSNARPSVPEDEKTKTGKQAQLLSFLSYLEWLRDAEIVQETTR
jgi:hypothetical protein